MGRQGGRGDAAGDGARTDAAAAAARAALVRVIVADGGLTDPAWRAAFVRVPRHLFVPYYYVAVEDGFEQVGRDHPDPRVRARWLSGAYADTPLATRVRDGRLISSSSQPSLMARMLEVLGVHDGDRVLEIGAGTGYNAGLLSHRLGEDRVTTVDLDPEIASSARDHLAAAGHRPEVVTGDGARGWATGAPYDRILATCSLAAVPPAWVAQCRPGGLVLAPLATGLIALRVRDARHAEGRFLHTSAYFVPLRGGPEPQPVDTRSLPPEVLDEEPFPFLLALTAGRQAPESVYELWEDAHRPGRERFGVTVRGDRQWAWLDSPDGPHTWPLGDGAAVGAAGPRGR
ncbi:methyltransferase domain-containing protein [Streptomyces sp. bgisy100]|uniref:methyltransferase domain-containing protein n=1 Tax=Streptomyces sp. bgisy100 TaxID=3413783 RepID=UPI003D70DBE3